MKIIVEQIVEMTPKLKKVHLADFASETVNIGIGDDFWFVNVDEKYRRSRLIVVDIRMAFSEVDDYAIVDVISPVLMSTQRETLTSSVLYNLIGDHEDPAPDFVEVDS